MGNELQLINQEKFSVTPLGLTAIGDVTTDEVLDGFECFGRIQDKAMVYVGDLAVIAEKQGLIENGKESEFYQQAAERSGLKKNSIQNAKNWMSGVDLCNRLQRCGIRHYSLVYQLPTVKPYAILVVEILA